MYSLRYLSSATAMITLAAEKRTAKIQAGGITPVTSFMMTNEEPQMIVAAMMSKR